MYFNKKNIMTQIMIDVPKTKEKEYKKIFNMFVKQCL
jgi:hypothetical protein